MESSSKSAPFAVRLRRLREERELTQSELARRAGMQPSAVAHFEADRRKPSFDNIRELAKALEVTIDYLMGGKEAPTTAFRDEGKLTAKDRDYIQLIIDTMVEKKDKR